MATVMQQRKKLITRDQVDLEVAKQYADKWIANALSTKAMDDDEREICRNAINAMYGMAKLPPPKHIVFVPSPLVLCLAGPIAAGIWYLSKSGLPVGKSAQDAATNAATLAAAYAATGAATRAATGAATYAATDAATRAATGAATDAATLAATLAATGFNGQHQEIVKFLLGCCQHYYQMWQGGNQWSGWTSFLDFWTSEHAIRVNGQDVFWPYRELALHSGPRIVHADFAMICDRPRILSVDDQSRPHGDGPSHEWRDGWRLWYWHGVLVDEQIIMRPETQTIEQISGEQNAEIKRIRIERFGWESYLKKTGAKVIDRRRNDVEGTREALMASSEGMVILVCHCPSTGRIYSMEVDPSVRTCEGAQNYLWSGSALSDRHVRKHNCIGRS